MTANQNALLEALQRRERSSNSLVDVKGIGKPQSFDGRSEERFLPWKTRIANFIGAVFPEFLPALDWAEEQSRPIQQSELVEQIGNVDDPD
eukprot:3290799-Karenia_brevis.AAC.1